MAEGSWDRRTPDSLAEGLSSDTEGTTQDTQETLHKCSAGRAGRSAQDRDAGGDTAAHRLLQVVVDVWRVRERMQKSNKAQRLGWGTAGRQRQERERWKDQEGEKGRRHVLRTIQRLATSVSSFIIPILRVLSAVTAHRWQV